ncbi:MAG: hypothetical protein HY231_16375 [Acidobacteria bacterium]|nr:hypothetical protein [Acidobacteriota bacterium]
MFETFCPDCGYQLHRSHSRSVYEKFVKRVSRRRLFRCHECGWRGWLVASNLKDPPPLKKLLPVLLTLFTILFITVLAIYIASS